MVSDDIAKCRTTKALHGDFTNEITKKENNQLEMDIQPSPTMMDFDLISFAKEINLTISSFYKYIRSSKSFIDQKEFASRLLRSENRNSNEH